MGVPLLDAEFLHYWDKLSQLQKKSLLAIAKNYVDSMEENGPATSEQYNRDITASMLQIDNGDFIAHQKAASTSQSWLNGQ